MADINSSNRTIAKNTIFLYFRSILMMGISLFSSRVILQALGVEDYGLYGAIGSIVTMFVLINGVLSAGTSRFLTFELGIGNKERLSKIFSASFAMHFCLAIILFIALETIGLWFLNTKLNIPEGRDFAANVVFQLSILTCMLSLTQVPYSASIIAHERMSIYAYVGILEAVFKLALIFALLYIPFTDNLIAYAVILAVWSIGLQVWYRFYCIRNFEECHLHICKDKSIYKNMLSYSLWDFIGQFCGTGINQGLNLLINIFFGVILNAARAVADQVETAITTFSGNFLTATTPQITKSYANKEYGRYYSLVTNAGKYAFFLLYIISFPIFLEADALLHIWLVEVPEHTLIFLRVTICITLFRVIARPVITAIHATGNVKFVNLTSGLFSVITYLPAVYILFKLGFPFWTLFFVRGICAMVSSVVELISWRKLFEFSVWNYLTNTYFKPSITVILASIPGIIAYYVMPECFLSTVVVLAFSFISSTIILFYVGLSKAIRVKLISFIITKIR